MKRKFIILTLLFGIVCAEEPQKVEETFSYFLGDPGPDTIQQNYCQINPEWGFRKRRGNIGFDSSLKIGAGFGIIETTENLIFIHAIELKNILIGYIYLNSCSKTTPYLGVGFANSVAFLNMAHPQFSLWPEFVVGKQLSTQGKRKNSIEIHTQAFRWSSMESRHQPKIYLYIKFENSF